MFDDSKLKTVGTIVSIVSLTSIVLYQLALSHAKCLYKKYNTNPETPLDVDSFVDAPPNYIKIALFQSMSLGSRVPSSTAVPLMSVESPDVAGLQVTKKANTTDGAEVLEIDNDNESPVVVGTIRMGFGHHRIAYATCSWALDDENTTTTYFHDLLNIESEEANLIKSTDAVYSKLSRISSNIGGIVEKIWGSLMLSGDSDALRISGLTAVHLTPLFTHLPKDTPIIATHCYVALAAVAAGFTNVINLVIDNHPQWFVVVPGCLNLVQGTVNYQCFLKMGVSPKNLQLAGHWIPRQLVENIDVDCQRRIARAADTSKPRRVLIPVGGAGAQRKFIVKFVRAVAPLVKQGKMQLFLNAGDHAHMKVAFEKILTETGLDYDIVSSTSGVRAFQQSLLDGNDPSKAVTLFSFDDYFPAVATTDILCRVADILACKPSELAFYPLPKLMVRRVGDHEQYSAMRAAELGDGTLEAREIKDCLQYLDTFFQEPLLKQMNESIMKNNKIGIYDGCKNAVRIALERKEAMKKR